ncbi:hypothetical protein D3C71_1985870 [compost metagenome]
MLRFTSSGSRGNCQPHNKAMGLPSALRVSRPNTGSPIISTYSARCTNTPRRACQAGNAGWMGGVEPTERASRRSHTRMKMLTPSM